MDVTKVEQISGMLGEEHGNPTDIDAICRKLTDFYDYHIKSAGYAGISEAGDLRTLFDALAPIPISIADVDDATTPSSLFAVEGEQAHYLCLRFEREVSRGPDRDLREAFMAAFSDVHVSIPQKERDQISSLPFNSILQIMVARLRDTHSFVMDYKNGRYRLPPSKSDATLHLNGVLSFSRQSRYGHMRGLLYRTGASDVFLEKIYERLSILKKA